MISILTFATYEARTIARRRLLCLKNSEGSKPLPREVKETCMGRAGQPTKLVFIPNIHRIASQIAATLPSFAGDDIAQQVVSVFLEFLGSPELREPLPPRLTIARMLRRSAFWRAIRESRGAASSDSEAGRRGHFGRTSSSRNHASRIPRHFRGASVAFFWRTPSPSRVANRGRVVGRTCSPEWPLPSRRSTPDRASLAGFDAWLSVPRFPSDSNSFLRERASTNRKIFCYYAVLFHFLRQISIARGVLATYSRGQNDAGSHRPLVLPSARTAVRNERDCGLTAVPGAKAPIVPRGPGTTWREQQDPRSRLVSVPLSPESLTVSPRRPSARHS